MIYTVYGLRLKGNREARYIGQTKHSPITRLRTLTSEAEMAPRKRPFSKWLLENRGNVEWFAISEHDTRADALAAESETINYALAFGNRVFNLDHVPANLRINVERAA